MIEIILIFAALFLLLISSFIDFKTKEVPDFLTNTFIVFGVLSQVILWIFFPTQERLFFTLLYFSISLLLSLSMYYSGVWGGGDVKVLIACSFLFGYLESDKLFFLKFLLNFLVAGAAYGTCFYAYYFVRNLKKLSKERKVVNVILLLFVLGTSVFFQRIWMFTLLFGLLLILLYNSEIVENSMKKWVSISKLTEGDWLIKEVKYRNIKIVPKPTGISKEDLRKLRKLYREGKVRKVLIKEGIPFVPVFLISFLITLYFKEFILLSLANFLTSS